MASNDASQSLYTDDALRQQIRICLMRIKLDEAFVDGELSSREFQTIKKGKDVHVKEKFVKYVSKSLLPKKKADKVAALTKRLMRNNLLEDEVAKFNPDDYDMEESPAPSEKQQTATKGKGKAASKVESDDKKEAEEPATKKRRRSGSVKPAKESKKNRIAFKISEKERRKLAEESKKEHISQKADVLERVPASHQKHWGQIMFGKWKKDPWRPVLVLGPYQVHPDLRDTWMKMFKNTKGDPQRMWCWCYWYGSPVAEAYSQQKVSTLMSYEKAVASKLHVLPANLQAKVDAGKKLKGGEEQAVKGYACLEEELKKNPEDRIPQKFTEDYENILKLDDEVSLNADDGYNGESDELESESDSAVSAPAPAPKKKTIVREKKVVVKKKKKEPKPVVEPPPLVTPLPMEIDDVIGEAELSEGDDNEDDAFEKSIDGDEDDEDLNYDEDEKVKKKGTVSKKRSSTGKQEKQKKSQKKMSVDMEVRPKQELKKSPKKAKQPEEEIDPVKQRKRERDRLRKRGMKEASEYELCIQRYRTVIDDLAAAVKSNDSTKVVRCMNKLKKGVQELTAPFIEDFKLAQVMKAAKAIMVTEEDKHVRKELWEEMKVLYEEKKKSVPEGWRARLTIPESKHHEVSSEKRKKRPEAKVESESRSEVSAIDGNEGMEPANETTRNANDMESESLRLDSARSSLGGDMERIPARNGKGVKSSDAALPEVHQTPTLQKQPKKTMSLAMWMNADKSKETTETPKPNNAPAQDPSASTKKIPSWLLRLRNAGHAVELSDDRQVGLEFFNEAAKLFPDTIERDGLATVLEGAAFAWATSKAATADDTASNVLYFEKIHSICGACAGKHQKGALVAAIMDGKYESAEEIVNLPDDVLFASFFGPALNGSC